MAKFHITGDNFVTNIHVALNLIVENIPVITGIYLIGFANRYNAEYIKKYNYNNPYNPYINYYNYQDIKLLIQIACDKSGLTYFTHDDFYTSIDDPINKNIVYIFNHDEQNLQKDFNEDNNVIAINTLVNKNAEIDWFKDKELIPGYEKYAKDINNYYHDNVLYPFREFTVDTLVSELKKKHLW